MKKIMEKRPHSYIGQMSQEFKEIKEIVKQWRVWGRDKMAQWTGYKAFCLAPSQVPGICYLLCHPDLRTPVVWRGVQRPAYPPGCLYLSHTNETEWSIRTSRNDVTCPSHKSQGSHIISLSDCILQYIRGDVQHPLPLSQPHSFRQSTPLCWRERDHRRNKEAHDDPLRIVSHSSNFPPKRLCMFVH
jgi:hypothetical protein